MLVVVKFIFMVLLFIIVLPQDKEVLRSNQTTSFLIIAVAINFNLAVVSLGQQHQENYIYHGRTDSVSEVVFISQQQKRARDDQMFRSISSCETFEKTHSKSSKWATIQASRPALLQIQNLVPVYCCTHWSVYSPFIIHEKSRWSSQYIRRNNSDHLSTALLFLFPSPQGFHLLPFFLN